MIEDYNYKGVYLRRLWIYNTLRNRINSIEGKIFNENNAYIFKNALQNYFCFGVDEGYKMLLSEYNKAKDKVIKWLNGCEKPYEIIYKTSYQYNTYNGVYGEYIEWGTGINETTHSIAKDYAMSKIKE